LEEEGHTPEVQQAEALAEEEVDQFIRSFRYRYGIRAPPEPVPVTDPDPQESSDESSARRVAT
jgi:hypothetical protein